MLGLRRCRVPGTVVVDEGPPTAPRPNFGRGSNFSFIDNDTRDRFTEAFQ